MELIDIYRYESWRWWYGSYQEHPDLCDIGYDLNGMDYEAERKTDEERISPTFFRQLGNVTGDSDHVADCAIHKEDWFWLKLIMSIIKMKKMKTQTISNSWYGEVHKIKDIKKSFSYELSLTLFLPLETIFLMF